MSSVRRYHLGLIGYPLGHSRSPELHQAALAAAGLDGEYRLFPIPPTSQGLEEIGTLIQQMRQGQLHGLNVTIPHKQNVQPFLDQLSDVARAVGAVNTIYVDGQGRVTGENTDVPGFLRDVRRLTGEATGTALVLGAGGSARAVVYALSMAVWRVRVLARRIGQTAELCSAIGAAGAEHAPQPGALTPAELKQAAHECDLLVNTTPLGMHPAVEGCPWPEDLPLPRSAAVYDLIYNPMETVLVRRARAAGLRAANGAGMLADQAALAFELWTRDAARIEPAPFEVMERVMQV